MIGGGCAPEAVIGSPGGGKDVPRLKLPSDHRHCRNLLFLIFFFFSLPYTSIYMLFQLYIFVSIYLFSYLSIYLFTYLCIYLLIN